MSKIKNNSVMKCCICDNERIGEFITINNKKYHLCCIEQSQTNWKELKKWLEEKIEGHKKWQEIKMVYACEDVLDQMQEIESGKND